MTVRDYLRRRDRLRYVVAVPGPGEGAERELEARVVAAVPSLEAAKEAVRWERERVRKETGERHAMPALLVLDLAAPAPVPPTPAP